jgi:hypothetical protein
MHYTGAAFCCFYILTLVRLATSKRKKASTSAQKWRPYITGNVLVTVESALNAGERCAYTGTNSTANCCADSRITCSDRAKNGAACGTDGSATQSTLAGGAHIGTAAEGHNTKGQRQRRHPTPPNWNNTYVFQDHSPLLFIFLPWLSY